MISILVPSRGRPAQCKRMVESAKATADDIEIHIAVLKEEKEMYEDFLSFHVQVVPEWSTVMTWNKLADNAKGSLLMLGSDDTIFTTPQWDKGLLNHYNALQNKIHVYSLKDSRDPDGTPHPIVSKEYKDAMGYFLPPMFFHWYCDTWTVGIAKANNCFTHLDDYLLIHDKPSDRGDADITHNRIRKQGWQERDSYVNESCQHILEGEKQRLASLI